MAAERHLANAGMIVVPTDQFYKKYDRHPMPVSPWEKHSSAEAHSIFANLITEQIIKDYTPELERYRIEKLGKENG